MKIRIEKKHCGACGKQFNTTKELVEHLRTCELALVGKKLMEKWNEEPEDAP